MDKQRKKNLVDAVQCMIPDAQLTDLEPRKLFFVGFAATMNFIHDTEQALLRDEPSDEPPESIPKE